MASRVHGKGSYNVICDVCGFKIKSTESRKRWDGLVVCKDDWEERHILDFYRGTRDSFPLPFTRPEPADNYITGIYPGETSPQDRTLNGSDNAFNEGVFN
jgi:hypothetical protein